MTSAVQPKTEKKSYTKPTVTEVRLVVEEAVLGLCKDGAWGEEKCVPEPCSFDQRS